MNERATLEIIAPTVEEAVARGLADLGLPQEAVEVDVLDAGSRGLLGIGGRQVRVRLTVKFPDVPPVPASDPPTAIAPASLSDEDAHALKVVEETTHSMLDKMRISARVSARYGEPEEDGHLPVLVDIHGDDLSILIGRRGQTLQAFQYITNMVVNKQVGHWVQLMVDVEGYRARREQQLRQMARRLADQVVKTGRRQVLEPMPAGERRIVHLELRDHPDVTTQSVGDEPTRKVTIVPK